MRIVRNNEDKGNIFDKHFRELRNSEVPPAGDLWDRIEYKLDEDRQRVKHDHWYHALLLLLIPLTAINVYLTYDLHGLYVSLFKKEATEQRASHEAVAANNFAGQFFSNGQTTIPFLNKYSFGEAEIAGSDDFLKRNALTPSPEIAGRNAFAALKEIYLNDELNPYRGDVAGDDITPQKKIPVERLLLETSITPQDVKFTRERNANVRKQTAVKGFHIGAEGGINQSMVLIKKSTLEPIIGSNVHRKLNLGAYYAVSMGYDFTRKFGLEAELIFCSKQGQRYSELLHGKIPVEGKIDLEYMSVPLLFKYKMTKMGGKSLNPRTLNLVAGLQYSRLKEATIQINDLDLQDATEPFNRDELGFVLGLEYDIFFSPNYFLTLGTRASISSDIHAFPYFVPEASQTYNVLVGVNASFRYLMKRR